MNNKKFAITIILFLFLSLNLFFIFGIKNNRSYILGEISKDKSFRFSVKIDNILKDFYFSKLSRITYTFKYHVFKTLFGELEVSENGWIFQDLYYLINVSQLDYKFVEEQVKTLSLLKNELSKRNIDLILLFTPVKAYTYRENAPIRYKIIMDYDKKHSRYSKNLFKPLLDKYNINYYDIAPDYMKLKSSTKYNLFSSTGCHWTLTGVALSLNNIFDNLSSKTKNVIYPKIEGMVILNKIFRSDLDFEEFATIYFAKRDKLYTTPYIKFDKTSPSSIYIVGESFSMNILDILCSYSNKPAFNKIVLQQYFRSTHSVTGEGKIVDKHFKYGEDISKLNIMSNVKNSNLLIIEQPFLDYYVLEFNQKFIEYVLQEFEKENKKEEEG